MAPFLAFGGSGNMLPEHVVGFDRGAKRAERPGDLIAGDDVSMTREISEISGISGFLSATIIASPPFCTFLENENIR
jgi:hypothetical protein